MKYYPCIILLLSFLSGTLSKGQNVFNSSFEQWHSVPNTFGGEDPDGWTSTNEVSAGANRKGILKSSDAHFGKYALEIMPLITDGANPLTAALCLGAPVGTPDFTSFKLNYRSAGAPINYAPARLHGFYRYSPNTAEKDSAYAIIVLKKYNAALKKTELVGKGRFTFTPSGSYSTFEVSISDSVKGITPDSIVISFFYQSLCTGFRSPGQDLLIDSLWLEKNSSVTVVNDIKNKIHLYPTVLQKGQPINVLLSEEQKNAEIIIYDITGKEVMALTSDKALKLSVNTAAWARGIYFYRIANDHSTLTSGRIMVTD